MDKQVITIKRFETPVGWMVAGVTDEGVCILEFREKDAPEDDFKAIAKLLNATVLEGEHKYIDQVEKELTEYFAGKRKKFTVPLVIPGTEFQQAVWQELQNIPYGSTRSYKQQSLALKNPEAIRAVAHANGMNRIAIIIPCHRVIGENGSMTGYAGGIWRKKWLLDLETGAPKLQL